MKNSIGLMISRIEDDGGSLWKCLCSSQGLSCDDDDDDDTTCGFNIYSTDMLVCSMSSGDNNIDPLKLLGK